MSEQKLHVVCAFDMANQEMWYVDSREKLSRRLERLSLAIPPITLADLKAMVYDSEREQRQDCVVDIEGWFYHSRRARGIEKGLFAQHLFVSNPAT